MGQMFTMSWVLRVLVGDFQNCVDSVIFPTRGCFCQGLFWSNYPDPCWFWVCICMCMFTCSCISAYTSSYMCPIIILPSAGSVHPDHTRDSVLGTESHVCECAFHQASLNTFLSRFRLRWPSVSCSLSSQWRNPNSPRRVFVSRLFSQECILPPPSFPSFIVFSFELQRWAGMCMICVSRVYSKCRLGFTGLYYKYTFLSVNV